MKLLQELLTLNEGQLKDKIIDLIYRAMDLTDTDSLDGDKAATRIITKLREIDTRDLTGGMEDEELIAMVKPFLGEDVNEEGEEDSVEQDEVEPKILSTAAGANGVKYMVVLDPTSEQVQVVDNTHKVYLQVPLVIWQQLARSQG
jgi:hypothetical protein